MKFKNLLTSVILLTMITTSFLSGCGKNQITIAVILKALMPKAQTAR